MMLIMLFPSIATFLPYLDAVSITCLTLSTFDANVETIILSLLCSLNIESNIFPTVLSLIVNPGLIAFVESERSASTPIRPISAKCERSILSPNTGV